jgi:hypothetical protein
MSKINGKYEQPQIEELLNKIKNPRWKSMKRSLILKYLFQRRKQIENIIANDDADLKIVVEQLLDDLKLARNYIIYDAVN